MSQTPQYTPDSVIARALDDHATEFKTKKDLIIISNLHRTAGALSTRLGVSDYDADLCHTIINEPLTSISHLHKNCLREDADVVLLGWRDMDIIKTELLLERVGVILQMFSGAINFYLDEYPTNEDDWRHVVKLADLVGKSQGAKIGFAHELLPNEDDHTDEEFAMKEVDDLRCRYPRHPDCPHFAIVMRYKGDTKTLWITREYLDGTEHGVIEFFVASNRRRFRESVDGAVRVEDVQLFGVSLVSDPEPGCEIKERYVRPVFNDGECVKLEGSDDPNFGKTLLGRVEHDDMMEPLAKSMREMYDIAWDKLCISGDGVKDGGFFFRSESDFGKKMKELRDSLGIGNLPHVQIGLGDHAGEYYVPKHCPILSSRIDIGDEDSLISQQEMEFATKQFFDAVVIHNDSGQPAKESPPAFGKTFDSHALRYTQLKDHS